MTDHNELAGQVVVNYEQQRVAKLLGLDLSALPPELVDNLNTHNVGVEVLDGCEVLRWDGCERLADGLEELLLSADQDLGVLTDDGFLNQMFGDEFLKKIQKLDFSQLSQEISTQIKARFSDMGSLSESTDADMGGTKPQNIPLLDKLWLSDTEIAKNIPACNPEGCKMPLLVHKTLVVLFSRFDRLTTDQKGLGRWLAVTHDIGKILDYQNGLHGKLGSIMVESLCRRINNSRSNNGLPLIEEQFIRNLLVLIENHHLAGSVSKIVTGIEGANSEIGESTDLELSWATMMSEAESWGSHEKDKTLEGEVAVGKTRAGEVYNSSQFQHLAELLHYVRQEIVALQDTNINIDKESLSNLCQYYGAEILDIPELLALLTHGHQLELVEVLTYFSVADIAASDKPEVNIYLERLKTVFPQLAHLIIEILTHDQEDRWQEGLIIRRPN